MMHPKGISVLRWGVNNNLLIKEQEQNNYLLKDLFKKKIRVLDLNPVLEMHHHHGSRTSM